MRLWSEVKSTKMLSFSFFVLRFVLFFRILCVFTPDSQSLVKENKLNIFKMDKKKKKMCCLM